MKAEKRNIAGVLTEQLQREIPSYQRPYSWEVEDANNLTLRFASTTRTVKGD